MIAAAYMIPSYGLTAFYVIILLSALLGILLVIPIGGADMPVVISLLNSYSGIAAAMTGFVLVNNNPSAGKCFNYLRKLSWSIGNDINSNNV